MHYCLLHKPITRSDKEKTNFTFIFKWGYLSQQFVKEWHVLEVSLVKCFWHVSTLVSKSTRHSSYMLLKLGSMRKQWQPAIRTLNSFFCFYIFKQMKVWIVVQLRLLSLDILPIYAVMDYFHLDRWTKDKIWTVLARKSCVFFEIMVAIKVR